MSLNACLIGIIVFLCSLAYEYGCVLWVRQVNGLRRWQAVGWSCFVASVQLLGVYESFTGLIFAALYVAGHGFGTYLGMAAKK